MTTNLHICLVCPSDVRLEETAALSVISRLRDQHAREANINCRVADCHKNADSRTTERQFPVDGCDILIAVLWTTADHDVLRALLENGPNGPQQILIYHRNSVPRCDSLDVSEQELLSDKLLSLQLYCTRLRSRSDFPANAWRTFEDPARFPELLEKDLQSLLDERLFGHLPPAGCWQGNPFRGLHAFGPEHAMVFCGREAAVQQTFELLIDRAAAAIPAILIAGASGSGKSSLARCGLANRLKQEFPEVPQVEMRPGAGDSAAPIQVLARKLENAIPETARYRMEQILEHNPSAAINILEAIQPPPASPRRIPQFILILDQLEELTAPLSDTTATQQLATAINLLVRRGLCWCIATIRSDMLTRLTEVPSFSCLQEHGGIHLLDPPTPAEIGLMIRRPARLAGLAFETNMQTGQSLEDLIREDAAHTHNILPLLQFTLSQIYQTRTPGGLLKFEEYQRQGGIPGCVARHADSVLNALPQPDQAAFKSVFRELVTVAADDATPSRQRIQESRFTDDENAKRLIDTLVEARLLVRDRQDESTTIELVHESLLRHWPRLAEWLQIESELLRKRDRLRQSCLRWVSAGKRKDLLLPSGTPLEEAEEVRKNGLLMAPRAGQEAEFDEYLRKSQNHALLRGRVRIVAFTALTLLTIVSTLLGFISSSLLKTANQSNADLRQQTEIAETSAKEAVEAQLQSLDLALDSVQGTLQEMEQLATSELANDRHAYSVHYLHAAENFVNQKRNDMFLQIDQRVAGLNQNPVLAPLFQTPLQDFRKRITTLPALDAAYWRHRQAVMLREFPAIQWRRKLHRRIDQAILSPDRRLLLLLTGESSNEVAIVWDLDKNAPTRSITPFSSSVPRAIATWAPDSQSFFLFSLQSTSPNPLVEPSILTRIHAHTGKPLSDPVKHRGVILAASCSSDGRFLNVVNQFDGSAAAYAVSLGFGQNAEQRQQSGTSPNDLQRNLRASVVRYDLQSMKASNRTSVASSLETAAIVDDWCAVLPSTPPIPSAAIDPKNSRIGLLQLSSDTDYWFPDVQGTGKIGLSEDGEFLAVTQQYGGFMLLQRTDDGLKKVAEAGVSTKIDHIIVHRPARQPSSQDIVQVIIGEVQQNTDQQLSTYNTAQKIAAYTYDLQSGRLQNTLNADTTANIGTLSLQRGGTGQRIAAGLSDSTARIWQQYPGRTLTPPLPLGGNPVLVDFIRTFEGNPGSNPPFVTVTSEGEITCWNPNKNALNESLEPGQLTGLKYFRRPDESPEALVVSQAPAEELIAWTTPQLAADGRIAVGRAYLDPDPRIVEIGFAVENIFWSDDSRYAVLISGRVQRYSADPNPLYDPLWAVAFARPKIPSRSQLAVIDMTTLQRVGEVLTFDGPIVGLQSLNDGPRCVLGFLSQNQSTGHIWSINLTDLSYTDLNPQSLQFSSFSASHDCDTVGITDRNGYPFLLKKDRPAEKLSFQNAQDERFTEICLSESGQAAMLIPDNLNSPVLLTNFLSSESWQIEEDKLRDGPRLVQALSGSNLFVLGGAASELFIVSGDTGAMRQKIPLPSPATGFACSRDQRLLAVADRQMSVQIFDCYTWHPAAPSFHLPMDSRFALSPLPHTSAQLQFSISGNLLISRSRPQKVRLCAPRDSTDEVLIRAAAVSLNSNLPAITSRPSSSAEQGDDQALRDDADQNASLRQSSSFDWVDAWFCASSIAESRPSSALAVLKATPLPDSSENPFATDSAVLMLKLATRQQDQESWRQAITWLTRPEAVSAVPWVDAATVIRNARLQSLERALIAMENSVLVSPDAEGPHQIGGAIANAHLSAMQGKFSEAHQDFWQVTLSPYFRSMVSYDRRLIFAALYQGLCGLQAGESTSEIPSSFALIDGENKPEIAISRRYYCYLAGLPTNSDVDLVTTDAAGNLRIRQFHEFCNQLEQPDGAERALEIARQMVQASPTQFSIPADGFDLFPVLRGHCRLFEADALCRLQRFQEAIEAVRKAEQDWLEHGEQIRSLQLETRFFWPERVGFEHMKKRLETQIATGKPLSPPTP